MLTIGRARTGADWEESAVEVSLVPAVVRGPVVRLVPGPVVAEDLLLGRGGVGRASCFFGFGGVGGVICLLGGGPACVERIWLSKSKRQFIFGHFGQKI